MSATDTVAGLVLGVDGGGSRCTAVVARCAAAPDSEPVVLGRGHGGAANPRVAGRDTACSSISAAIDAAFADAGLAPQPVASACLGLAGVGLADERDAIRDWAGRAGIARRVVVVSDGLVLFADASAEPWGVALVAGTGSLALARRRDAPLTADAACDRCGGWGPILGDEGSGHALGSATLKAALRAGDGRGPDTLLGIAVLRRFNAETPADLVARIHSADVGRREIADVARETLAAADAGDAVAVALVRAAAGDLAAHVLALATRNGFAASGYPLRLAGGLLTGSGTLRRLVIDALVAAGMPPESVTVVADPAFAAARLAVVQPAPRA